MAKVGLIDRLCEKVFGWDMQPLPETMKPIGKLTEYNKPELRLLMGNPNKLAERRAKK